MNLGFDIDGVVCDFTGQLNRVIKKRYEETLTQADMYCYDINLVLGIPKEEVAEIVFKTLKSDLPLQPFAKETLDRLASEGHKIYLITARSEKLAAYTKKWLKKRKVPYEAIYHLSEGRKHLVEVDIDLAVEDNLEEAIELTRKVKHVLLYNQPWNKTLNVKGLIKRVNNWSEIYTEVQATAKPMTSVPTSSCPNSKE
jgi:uncharacterized protein